MSFINHYYKRTAGTERPCFVCYRPTTTVLATINTVDFLYTCPAHLSDPGFATLKNEEKSTSESVSTEEIARVKLEWEEKQKSKLKDKEKEKDSGTKDNKNAEQQTDKSADKGKETSPKSPSTTPSTPTHERYVLHRDFFAMRQVKHQRRNQAEKAKELVPRLPSAPTGKI